MTVLQPEMITRLRILGKVAEMTARTSGGSAGGRALLEELPESLRVSAKALDDHVRLLEQQGLVKGIFTMGGLAAVSIMPRGKDVAAQFERDRRDPVARLLQLEDDFLRWVYVCVEIEDVEPDVERYLSTGAAYLGVDYTPREVSRAISRLRAAELLLPENLKLTPDGQKIVEHRQSVRDLERGATVNKVTTHVTGSTNVSVGSSYVMQTATMDPSWASEVTRLLEIISQSLPALPADIGEVVVPLVEEAVEGAAGAELSRVKRALGRIADLLNDTAAGALGGHLATQIPQVLALLG